MYFTPRPVVGKIYFGNYYRSWEGNATAILTFHRCCHFLAKDYEYQRPSFTDAIKHSIEWTPKDKFHVNYDYSTTMEKIFLYRMHSCTPHNFNALSLAPYRNAVILNTTLALEHFELERISCFKLSEYQN